MSSFVVQPKTINRIVSFLDDVTASYSDIHGSSYRALLSKYRIFLGDGCSNGGTEKGLQQLVNALWDLNVEAVQQRYPDARDNLDEAPGSYDEQKLVHHKPYQYAPVCLIQVYKSLQCLVYQCSEGNVPNNPLYKMLEELEGTIAKQIVSDLPAYDKAEWD